MGKFITWVSDIATPHNSIYTLPAITGTHFVHITPILGSTNRCHLLSPDIQTGDMNNRNLHSPYFNSLRQGDAYMRQ